MTHAGAHHGLTHTHSSAARSPPDTEQRDTWAPRPSAPPVLGDPFSCVAALGPVGVPLLWGLRPPLSCSGPESQARLGEGRQQAALLRVSRTGHLSHSPCRVLRGAPTGARAPGRALVTALPEPAFSRPGPGCPVSGYSAGFWSCVACPGPGAGHWPCEWARGARLRASLALGRGPDRSPLPAPVAGLDTLPASVRGYSRSWWPPSGP